MSHIPSKFKTLENLNCVDRIVETILNRTNKVRKHFKKYNLSNISIKSSSYVCLTDLSHGRNCRKKVVTKNNEILSFNKLSGDMPFWKSVYHVPWHVL